MFSPLTDSTLLTDKHSSRRGLKIDGMIVHHHGTTGIGGLNRLVYSKDKASANYIIMTTGELIGSVPEEYRAWTSGSWEADASKITVEIQNSTGSPEWRVSDAAFETLCKLYADVAKRHAFEPTRANLKGHRDYAATACPGPYLYGRLDDVAKAAGEYAPPPSTERSIEQMADEVIAGKHGNGHDQRRQSLGVTKTVYAQVRAEVNRRVG